VKIFSFEICWFGPRFDWVISWWNHLRSASDPKTLAPFIGDLLLLLTNFKQHCKAIQIHNGCCSDKGIECEDKVESCSWLCLFNTYVVVLSSSISVSSTILRSSHSSVKPFLEAANFMYLYENLSLTLPCHRFLGTRLQLRYSDSGRSRYTKRPGYVWSYLPYSLLSGLNFAIFANCLNTPPFKLIYS